MKIQMSPQSTIQKAKHSRSKYKMLARLTQPTRPRQIALRKNYRA